MSNRYLSCDEIAELLAEDSSMCCKTCIYADPTNALCCSKDVEYAYPTDVGFCPEWTGVASDGSREWGYLDELLRLAQEREAGVSTLEQKYECALREIAALKDGYERLQDDLRFLSRQKHDEGTAELERVLTDLMQPGHMSCATCCHWQRAHNHASGDMSVEEPVPEGWCALIGKDPMPPATGCASLWPYEDSEMEFMCSERFGCIRWEAKTCKSK